MCFDGARGRRVRCRCTSERRRRVFLNVFSFRELLSAELPVVCRLQFNFF